MHSAIYSGWLRHRRFAPKEHEFRYSLFLMYLDLAEIDTVFAGRWLWSARRRAVARFDRSDYLGDPSVPLDAAVRDLVHDRTGRRPEGPIRLLTHLKYFGYAFNPVSFYYCFDRADTRVTTIVAEVTNTPWRERHCYVLDSPDVTPDAGYHRYRTAKSHHVSPFMPMDVDYTWGFSAPGERLNVHMALHRDGKIFDATLCTSRTAITPLALARVLIGYPLMTLKVIASIHWEALMLWLKRIPVHPHAGGGAKSEAPGLPKLEAGASAAKRS